MIVNTAEDRFSRRALLKRMGVGAAMLPLVHAEHALGQTAANPFPRRLVLTAWCSPPGPTGSSRARFIQPAAS